MKTTNHKIAIIIPSYNSEKYIRGCLESIIAQTYKDWTAYVVDDGSTDSSPQILEEYQRRDERFVVFHKENGGVASARNYALDRIGNEGWLSFIDADDFIAPYMYEYIIDDINKASEKEIDYVRLFPRKTVKLYAEVSASIMDTSKKDSRVVSVGNYFKKENVGGFVASIFVKTEIVNSQRIRFVESMRLLEDQVFSINCAVNSHSLLIHNNDCYYYYSNPVSATHSHYDISNDIIQCINNVHAIIERSEIQEVVDYYNNSFIKPKLELLIKERIKHLSNATNYKLYNGFCISDFRISLLSKVEYCLLKLLERI